MYIPVEWASKRLFVKFYGVQSVADLFVNGYHVGTHRGGATAFTFEITDKIRFGSDNSTYCPPRPSRTSTAASTARRN